MTNKKWIKVFIAIVLMVLLPIVLTNFIIDPLWTFNHSNQFNNAQQGFNERQQKTNRAYFIGLEKYDTLLIGSSRSTYINQHDFDNMNVFNYASSNMYPYEYNDWINIAKKIKGKDFKTIIIGMDFFSSSDGRFYKKTKHRYKAPKTYFKVTRTPFYRYKQLLSITLFKKSLLSIKHSFMPGTEDYTRTNVKHTRHVSKNRKDKSCQEELKGFSTDMYGDTYHYNKKIEYYIEELKKNNPNTQFIIYTTPVSEELFKLLISLGNFNDYQNWLKVLVSKFDTVYHFMDINTITRNKSNYPDLHHYYPLVGTLMANKISGHKNDNIPKDFGIILTKDNIEQYLKNLKQQSEINDILKKRNNVI